MKNNHKIKKTIIKIVVFLFFLSAILLGVLYAQWLNKYQNNTYPNTMIGELDISNLNKNLAIKKIKERITTIESRGIVLKHGEKRILMPSIIAPNPDLSIKIFNFDTDKTEESFVEKNKKTSFLSYLINASKIFPQENNNPVYYNLDNDLAKAYLSDNLKDIEIEPLNASFLIKNENENFIYFEIIPERIGKTVDYSLFLNDLKKVLSNMSDNEITLKTISSRPTVYKEDLIPLKEDAKKLMKNGDITLNYKIKNSSSTKSIVIKKIIIASWIKPEQKNENNYIVSLDEDKIANYLEENIAPDIDLQPERSKYELKDGKMISWQSGQSGQKLLITDNAKLIKNSYLNSVSTTDLIIEEILEDTDTNSKIQIEEILGTGHSNFAGSPANRVHNIEVGAQAVHGMLIAPGEEFSLIKALGEIDASSGYLPELVIKNNKTIPEYGGGLCQVGTTIFRSATESGLPITARQNHSYRVSYYEPAGTDAAIYDPWPDMRFLNDTGNYILIQSRIENKDIYFDFWGKSDGRVASSSYPVIYNITTPPPTKIVESEDLAPGEKKCTERAHNGADAYFDYQVIYADGQEKNTRFKSHYVPWQEVCLVGKEIATEDTVATTTEAIKSE